MPTNKHWGHSPWFWHWDYNYITGSTQNRITECGRQLSSKGQSSLKGDKLPNSNPVWQGACQYHWHTWGGMKGWWGASPKKGLKRIQLHSIQYSVWQRLTFAPLTWDCSNLWSEAGPINTQAFLNSLSSSPRPPPPHFSWAQDSTDKPHLEFMWPKVPDSYYRATVVFSSFFLMVCLRTASYATAVHMVHNVPHTVSHIRTNPEWKHRTFSTSPHLNDGSYQQQLVWVQ